MLCVCLNLMILMCNYNIGANLNSGCYNCEQNDNSALNNKSLFHSCVLTHRFPFIEERLNVYIVKLTGCFYLDVLCSSPETIHQLISN